MKIINNGICAPIGFKANGIHAGIRKNQTKRDLALIVSDVKCVASSVYTTNLVKGAPLVVTKENIQNGYAQAIICNSGNANTCNKNGIEIAKGMCDLVSKYIGIEKIDVIVASTGVIGKELSIEPFKNSMEKLVGGLCNDSSLAEEAIMTTDTKKKTIAVEFMIGDTLCKMGGIAKGSGMIHPNMATMLVFITTDVKISKNLLDKALKEDVIDSFNMISIDGDTSTNDMVTILANGLANNEEITEEKGFNEFKEALNVITSYLCKAIAQDGEGATKMIECSVVNAKTKDIARKISKSVITSNLFKAAMFGADANWGRIMCAIGYSNVDIDVSKIDILFKSKRGSIKVCENGFGVPFIEEDAKNILSEDEIYTIIDLKDGDEKATAWGCDLTYEYVKINGDYRT